MYDYYVHTFLSPIMNQPAISHRHVLCRIGDLRRPRRKTTGIHVGSAHYSGYVPFPCMQGEEGMPRNTGLGVIVDVVWYIQ